MKKDSGFTLVELMVVISLVALMMAWGIPAFSSWEQKHGVESEMAQLYSDLQYARMNAYANKELTGICWDSKTYHIAYDSDGDGVLSNSDAKIGATVTPKYALNVATQASGQTALSFDSRGFLDPNDTVTFSVANSYGAPTDCVSVTLTMITLGKMTNGTCVPPQ